MEITLLRPKDAAQKSIQVTLSERTIKLLQFYAEYCQRGHDDIIEHYLEEIFKIDTKFQAWGSSKRNNKQFMKLINEISSQNIFDPEAIESLFNDTASENKDSNEVANENKDIASSGANEVNKDSTIQETCH